MTMRVSRSLLKALAALTWYVGGGVLLFKGTGYLVQAGGAGPTLPAVLSGILGVTGGMLRGRTMFVRACRRNLRRIEALHEPRIWQFFRPGFFAALAVMIAGGAVLAWLAETGYWGAVLVGGLELVIATALVTSSVAFRESAGRRSTREPGQGESTASERPSPQSAR